ncbi:hypothetical protein Enr13x_05240 [Stieleria neptunia]|uniref:Uncharacterized protein n=1 Tax=Stieleria neptunia TaxID=2527979 RepID=A0A518HIQ0_9BACT|nr:hypothetical protein [Stieleria neptunia]QDV40689.1 hypothetical protein Enr13x_05240 [Stieleria neptunia]
MTRRDFVVAALACLSLLGLAWSVLHEREHQQTRETLESQLKNQRRMIGTLQRSLLQRLNEMDPIGMRIEDIPDAEILVDQIFTPESEGWDFITRTYDGPRNGVLRMFCYGLDERPPEEHVATFFMIYTLDGEITDVEEVSPLY